MSLLYSTYLLTSSCELAMSVHIPVHTELCVYVLPVHFICSLDSFFLTFEYKPLAEIPLDHEVL